MVNEIASRTLTDDQRDCLQDVVKQDATRWASVQTMLHRGERNEQGPSVSPNL